MRTAQFRVVHAGEAGFPGFYRVIWNAHAPEFTDLVEAERVACMAAVATVERALRDALQPVKVNLAALGNVVPHLHWHVIARFAWDSRFPAPVWAEPVRGPEQALLDAVQARLASLEDTLKRTLS